jgi:hypothetical protein
MKKQLIAIALAAALMPASSYAKDSTDIALALGTVIASIRDGDCIRGVLRPEL